MTFAVMIVEQDVPKKRLGTIWATEEGQAASMARELFSEHRGNVIVQQSDDREIPLRIPN